MSDTPADPLAARSRTPVTASAVIRMTPLWREGSEPPSGFMGDLKVYAEGLAGFIAGPLGRFADARGGDCFVAVVLQQGELTAGVEYRDGEFVTPAPGSSSRTFLEGRDALKAGLLALAARWERFGDGQDAQSECAAELREAISAALQGEESTDA